MSKKNIELASIGLKCDNPVCDWKEETIKVADLKDWINAKCPKCNQNVLTLEDYNNTMLVMATADLLNKFTIEELEEMSKGKTIDDIKLHAMIKDAKGLEHLVNPNELVIMFVGTHKKVTIKEFKPVN